uniref:MADS-box protein 16 n=1 Tax=Cunninghamia lanceolata TaxID=28977 RepID=A0A8F2Z0C2_CUNLA|nr:MADS-box protein 16 [Cunninghamia lanceolata]
MVRGKTQMKRIENATSRQVTFSKRRNGLLKKAYELAVLCDAEVALIIFSPRGKLYEYSSNSMQILLEKYQKCSHENNTNKTSEQDAQYLKQEIANMRERIKSLETTQRNMLGEDLTQCSLKDLADLEVRVERGLTHIRAHKEQFLMETIKQCERKERLLIEENTMLRKKDQILSEENALLRKKCGGNQFLDGSTSTSSTVGHKSNLHTEVQTQLMMRPPDVQDHLGGHDSD